MHYNEHKVVESNV